MEVVKQINEYQEGLFTYVEEFFHRVTGQTARDFAPLEEFSSAIKKDPEKLARRIPDSLKWVDETIRPYYANKGTEIYHLAKGLAGLKLVLGGSGRFGEAHIDSIQQTLLYADTILVPDPFLPWIETPREGERFRVTSLIKAAFLLLQLKPIMDARLPFPAVFVFPSFEKLLEERDSQTLDDQLDLVVDVLAFYVSPTFQSIDDVQKYAVDNPDDFLKQVEKHGLFVPPEGKIGEPIVKALPHYEEFVSKWRSPEFVEYFSGLSPALKVLNGIMERLAPQYHLLENVEELRANPLICIEAHAHYFRLISRTNTERLVKLSLLDKKQGAIMDALSSKEFRWLSNVPMKELIELRKNNENALFRDRLRQIAERFHETELSDISVVTAELNKEIEEMIFDHEREVSDIQDKYSRKLGMTAVLAWATLGSHLIPSLAPHLGVVAPLGLATQFIAAKREEILGMRKTSKSVFGVLARAKNE